MNQEARPTLPEWAVRVLSAIAIALLLWIGNQVHQTAADVRELRSLAVARAGDVDRRLTFLENWTRRLSDRVDTLREARATP